MLSFSSFNRAHMSEQPKNDKSESPRAGMSTLKIFFLLMAIFVMVGLPVGGYMLGNFIGIHFGVSDINNEYAFSGLYQTVYNATGVSSYHDLSGISLALGNTLLTNDVSTMQLLGLLLGLLADAPAAVLLLVEYKRLDF